MSRIDDADPSAQRAAEQLAIQRKKEEARGRQRTRTQGRFAKLLQRPEPPANARTQQESGTQADERHSLMPESGEKRAAARAFVDPPHGAARPSVAEDAKLNRESTSEATERGARGSSPDGTGLQSEGHVRANSDAGSDAGAGSSPDDGDQPAPQAPPAFRFNPALVAPVPVAKKKEASGSEQLRALAAELAQRIVERVRVGTNAAGMPEFQIDLRSDVLRGVSIKISSGGGSIRALFSGTDPEVLRLLRDNADGLKQALKSRGLTLGELQIEERA